jgi:hypothetical protein
MVMMTAMAAVPTIVVAATAVMAPPVPVAMDLNDYPLVPPNAYGVAAGIADADRLGASAKAQPVNPIIRSLFILVSPPWWPMLLRIISLVFAMLAEQSIQRRFRKDGRKSAPPSPPRGQNLRICRIL